MPPDEAAQDILPDENKIELAVLNQIRRQRIKKYFNFQQYKVLEVW